MEQILDFSKLDDKDVDLFTRACLVDLVHPAEVAEKILAGWAQLWKIDGPGRAIIITCAQERTGKSPYLLIWLMASEGAFLKVRQFHSELERFARANNIKELVIYANDKRLEHVYKDRLGYKVDSVRLSKELSDG